MIMVPMCVPEAASDTDATGTPCDTSFITVSPVLLRKLSSDDPASEDHAEEAPSLKMDASSESDGDSFFKTTVSFPSSSEVDKPIFTKITSAEDEPPSFTTVIASSITSTWSPTTGPWLGPSQDVSTLSLSDDGPTSSAMESSTIIAESPSAEVFPTTGKTASETETTAEPTSPGGDSDPGPDQDKLSNEATIGIVIGIIAVVLAIIYIGRRIYKKQKEKKQRRGNGPAPAGEDGAAGEEITLQLRGNTQTGAQEGVVAAV